MSRSEISSQRRSKDIFCTWCSDLIRVESWLRPDKSVSWTLEIFDACHKNAIKKTLFSRHDEVKSLKFPEVSFSFFRVEQSEYSRTEILIKFAIGNFAETEDKKSSCNETQWKAVIVKSKLLEEKNSFRIKLSLFVAYLFMDDKECSTHQKVVQRKTIDIIT